MVQGDIEDLYQDDIEVTRDTFVSKSPWIVDEGKEVESHLVESQQLVDSLLSCHSLLVVTPVTQEISNAREELGFGHMRS
jgi:hypothetical protein